MVQVTSEARERILEAATALFYRHGINNVGIDRIIAESGVAKMTLYRHFRSKDELVLAFLEKMNTDWTAWLRERVAALSSSVQERPLAVFDALGEWFTMPAFRGCPFISTAAEIHDPTHQVHQAAWRFKERLRDYFCELLLAAGHADAAELGDQFLLLADGAMVRAALSGDPGSARNARRVAERVLGRSS